MTRNAANDTTRRQRALAGEGDDLPARMSYTEAERDGVHAQKARLARMAKKGADWDGTAANDNIAWPLATALIREGNTELLKAAIDYRKLYDTAKSNAMLGFGSSCLGSIQVDEDTIVSRSGKVVKLSSPKRKTSPVEVDETGVQSNWSSVPKPWNGDAPVNDAIDARRLLCLVQIKLGQLCEAVEMAVVDGSTYKEIGEHLGVSGRSEGTAVGRTIVHLGLTAVKDAMSR
ncbi:p107 [Rhizobium phage 16-3]|uniref:p107 n=1 Tax=Rhizobium phage 16-3 TaxID=10704 RepID=UPI00017BA664|nr:p107 [Rhizobium phage 16-3]ABF71353.1 p107 [Rhizobium phage 16-3]